MDITKVIAWILQPGKFRIRYHVSNWDESGENGLMSAKRGNFPYIPAQIQPIAVCEDERRSRALLMVQHDMICSPINSINSVAVKTL